MDNAGPDGATCKTSLAVVIYRGEKSWGVYNFMVNGLFLKKRPKLAKTRSVRPSNRLKTVDLDYRSSLSVPRLVRFWFKSLQSLTAHDRQFLYPGNLFLLAVCMHDVALYLCSIFCSRSLVQFSTASYRAFGARNTPQTVSHNLETHSKSCDKPSTCTKLSHVSYMYRYS